MWSQTRIVELLKIRFPIIQAPLAGGATSPELVAAVSNAGALGSFAGGYLPANEIREAIIKIRKLTDKPFAVNLFVPNPHHATQEEIIHASRVINNCCQELHLKNEFIKPPYAQPFAEQISVLLAEKIPVFSFTFGIPDKKWLEEIKKK